MVPSPPIAIPKLVDRFAADELVASLLLVHGLHPHGVERRIEDALDGVRPYLGSHGGDVTLLDVAGDDVRLQFAGSCKSCPSSAVTLEFAVEDAVRAAAPEITSIEVVAAQAGFDVGRLIPADSLMSRVQAKDSPPAPPGTRSPSLAISAPGEVGGFLVAGVPILACRVGRPLFAYHDRCGRCDESMAGAALHRPMGAPIGQAGAALPALPCTFRRGARRRGPRRRRRPRPSRPHPAAAARRRAVGRGTGRGRAVCWMTQPPYDVLARIRANKPSPQPAGRALRDVRRRDRRRASARRQCRGAPTDVHVPRLLSVVLRPARQAALPGGARIAI